MNKSGKAAVTVPEEVGKDKEKCLSDGVTALTSSQDLKGRLHSKQMLIRQ
jgi:hypothetical protein